MFAGNPEQQVKVKVFFRQQCQLLQSLAPERVFLAHVQAEVPGGDADLLPARQKAEDSEPGSGPGWP